MMMRPVLGTSILLAYRIDRANIDDYNKHIIKVKIKLARPGQNQ